MISIFIIHKDGFLTFIFSQNYFYTLSRILSRFFLNLLCSGDSPVHLKCSPFYFHLRWKIWHPALRFSMTFSAFIWHICSSEILFLFFFSSHVFIFTWIKPILVFFLISSISHNPFQDFPKYSLWQVSLNHSITLFLNIKSKCGKGPWKVV